MHMCASAPTLYLLPTLREAASIEKGIIRDFQTAVDDVELLTPAQGVWVEGVEADGRKQRGPPQPVQSGS